MWETDTHVCKYHRNPAFWMLTRKHGKLKKKTPRLEHGGNKGEVEDEGLGIRIGRENES